jgi:hypothetical protein
MTVTDLMERAQKEVRDSYFKLTPLQFAERVATIHGDIGCKCPWCDLARAYLEKNNQAMTEQRNVDEAAARLAVASESELAEIVRHDPDMIRDVAKTHVIWPECKLCHGKDPECELCGGQQWRKP